MSDYNSSLPVRTQNDGDVVAKIADATTPSQQLKVEADGSINVNDNGGSLTVDATDLDIRDLVFATDKVDVSGSSNVGVNDDGGSLTVDAIDLDIRDLAFATDKVDVSGSSNVGVNDDGGSLTVDAIDLDIRDLAFATDKVDVSGSSNVGVNDDGGSLTVDAVDLDIRDLAAATDSVSAWLKDESGNAFSESNPLPVYITEDPGTERLEFDQASAIAANATSTHSAAAAVGGTKWYGMTGSASGKCKWDIYYGPTGSEVLKVVLFNSTATPNVEFKMDKPILLAAGNSVKIIKTNRDNQAQDLYDTIVMINV